MKKILIPQKIHEKGVQLLESFGYETMTLSSDNEEAVIANIKDCDALIVRTTEINEKIIDASNKLKVIARHGIGVDNINLNYAQQNNIIVCNSPTSNINSVAEHTVGLMLAVSKRIVEADEQIRNGNFNSRNTLIGTELKGKTIGIIGLGNIGKLVAEKCHFGFGSNIIGYDLFVKDINQYIKRKNTLEELVAQADIISLHLPYLNSLHHLIDKKIISNMKSNSIFINTARGPLVDEKALYKALKNKDIKAAGVDCYEKEPTDYNNPLFSLNNVVLTPHMAAHTEEALINMAMTPAEEIIRVLNGESPLYKIV